VRTTINISESLYRAAKARAALTSQTVSQVIEDAVREALRPAPDPVTVRDALPTFGAGGVLPGVDLSSGTALRASMDEESDLDALR
jgi:hypothetical protein